MLQKMGQIPIESGEAVIIRAKIDGVDTDGA